MVCQKCDGSGKEYFSEEIYAKSNPEGGRFYTDRKWLERKCDQCSGKGSTVPLSKERM